MDKESEYYNSIIETTNDNVAKKPEHVIKAEISIEIIDDDDTPKVKYANPWGTVVVLSFIAMLVSLFVNGIAFLVSYAIFLVSISFSSDKIWDRTSHPGKYID